MILLYISLGGFLGAVLRHVLSKKLNKNLPYGTFLVNIIGSFMLGYFINKGFSNTVNAFLGIGFCGAFTTFSTFNFELYRLYQDKGKLTSFFYTILTYTIGIVFAIIGFRIAMQ